MPISYQTEKPLRLNSEVLQLERETIQCIYEKQTILLECIRNTTLSFS